MKHRHLLAICLWLIVWFSLAGLRGEENAPPPAAEGSELTVTGTVYRIVQQENGQSIYLKNISIENSSASLPKNTIVYCKENTELEIGNRLTVTGICAYPQELRNPGGFDARSYYRAMDINFFVQKGVIVENNHAVSYVRNTIFRLRERMMESLLKSADDTDAGILGAMLLGDRSELSDDIQELYQDAGIIHLLAISGLHISMTGMALYRMLRKAGLAFAISSGISGSVMIGYACMTDFRVSAVRAVLMFCVFLMSQIAGRTYDLATALAVSAAVLLAGQPANITQAGFLMSFFAVAGVLLSNTWESRFLKGTGLGVSLSVQLTSTPWVLYYYFKFPLYALGLNLLILPLMPVVLGFGIAGMMGALLHPLLGELLIAPAHYVLAGVELLCKLARRLPLAVIVTGKPSIAWVVGYYLIGGGLLFASSSGMPARWKLHEKFRNFMKIDLIKLTLAIILLLGGFFRFSKDTATMTFLDVGQGDGCCLETADGSVWMIDGGSSSQSDVYGRCLEPFLNSKGIDTVDYWMVSHYDDDHINGLLAVLENYEKNLTGKNCAGISVGTILLPAAGNDEEIKEKICSLAAKQQITVQFLKSGDVLESEDLTVRILSPSAEKSYENSNEASLAAEFDCGSFSVLMTGDLEGTGEKDLIAGGTLEDIDILKVAHHGSKYTTSAQFLEETQPEISVISCKKNNRYGHPHEELLERLDDAGSAAARTDLQGAVIVSGTDDGYEVRTMVSK